MFAALGTGTCGSGVPPPLVCGGLGPREWCGGGWGVALLANEAQVSETPPEDPAGVCEEIGPVMDLDDFLSDVTMTSTTIPGRSSTYDTRLQLMNELINQLIKYVIN